METKNNNSLSHFVRRGFYGKADLESATNKQRSQIWDLFTQSFFENLHEVEQRLSVCDTF